MGVLCAFPMLATLTGGSATAMAITLRNLVDIDGLAPDYRLARHMLDAVTCKLTQAQASGHSLN